MSVDFNSRRSCVVCTKGCVASSQHLASEIGIGILKKGGNAADAAVAMAAALNVTEPCSTGIGGDAFCLFYDSKANEVHSVNGSGRAPSKLTVELLHSQGFSMTQPFPAQTHGHSVTVPGAPAAWIDTVEKFGSGKLSMLEILDPAIELAETGYPVQELTASFWNKGSYLLTDPNNRYGTDMLLNGQAPKHGEIMRMPHLANTLRELGIQGKSGFYCGRIAKAIADVVQYHGGVMTTEDLASHVTTFEDPISIDYKGYKVWEVPPNGQGITTLIALNILEGMDLKGMGHNSAEYIHSLAETLKLSFTDTTWFCADTSQVEVPITQLLSKEYAAKRRSLIKSDRASSDVQRGSFSVGNDTVYFTTADKEGNACSFINSNFMGFGTGFVPEGCGFTLQNRGCGFSLDPKHPNVLAPNKRPFHTIIPGMVTDTNSNELLVSFGVMGGFMQPQGQVQTLLNMIEFGMDPQKALDVPRLCVGGSYGYDSAIIAVEEGISPDVVQKLKSFGHTVEGPVCGENRSRFGRGQIITRGPVFRGQEYRKEIIPTLWAGSDPRGDGMAIGYCT
ncbi:glutathione hydrolase-like YwrD proenzyme [Saccostrea echinata]|uniref:glutathione hydrolase-like YwrD proenzyme n=1 Tax=Saccostrea echinata TaxID=191078 RepID=UPI002A816E5B|nr:glutathione hydrolase-like YwrD proenzyme [Saccostrea echinata]